MVAQDQGRDVDVIADIKIQGKTKPLDVGIFREYAVLQDELFVLMGMMGGPFVQLLHSFIKFSAPGRRPGQYDGGGLGSDRGSCRKGGSTIYESEEIIHRAEVVQASKRGG